MLLQLLPFYEVRYHGICCWTCCTYAEQACNTPVPRTLSKHATHLHCTCAMVQLQQSSLQVTIFCSGSHTSEPAASGDLSALMPGTRASSVPVTGTACACVCLYRMLANDEVSEWRQASSALYCTYHQGMADSDRNRHPCGCMQVTHIECQNPAWQRKLASQIQPHSADRVVYTAEHNQNTCMPYQQTALCHKKEPFVATSAACSTGEAHSMAETAVMPQVKAAK